MQFLYGINHYQLSITSASNYFIMCVMYNHKIAIILVGLR